MNAILTLHKINLSFADKTIFKDLSLNIHNNSKICLIGKNGSGKTSLMNIITGELELDHGKRWLDPLIKISYLKQHIAATSPKNIYDFILSNIENKKHNTEYSYIIKKITTPFGLNLKSLIKELSGGELRKVALACALINEPDLLLLDEPTNHLDIEAIKWLEEYLKAFRGSYICISHDKRFLENISNQVFWLDRGNIKICPYGYKKFFEWSQKLLAQEKRELDNRQKNLNIEIDWSNRGVKARRKRDMRRLNEMKQKSELLKQDKNSYDNTIKKIALVKSKQNHSSKLQVEFIKVSKFFKKKKQKPQFCKISTYA
jgi:ATP-binding cassette subfamily F protein uup